MNNKNIIIGALSVSLIISLYFNLSTITKQPKSISLNEAIRNTIAYGAVDGNQKTAFVQSKIKQNSPLISFNTSKASDCEQWLDYIEYYWDKSMEVLAKYVTDDDWASITSSQIDSHSLTADGSGGGDIENVGWGGADIPEEMLRDIGSRITTNDQNLLWAYTQAIGEMSNRAMAACSGNLE